MLSARLIASFFTLTVLAVYFLLYGPNKELEERLQSTDLPDFSRYVPLQTLSPEQFPLDDVNRRVIVVGDIHGMAEQLQILLVKVSYDPSSDVLISLGDIVTKGPHAGSMEVLEFMASHNITAVRGNHDQMVIEWRTWLNWIHSLPGGTRWLEHVHLKWEIAQEEGVENVEKWVKKQLKKDKKYEKWWKMIPKGWKLFGDHYEIAEKMTHEQYTYMVRVPLKIHIPHAHTFIAHAGILASDPNYKLWHKRQPLAHIPKLPTLRELSPDEETSALRELQELGILHDIPHNIVPWNTLNMRGILDNHTITRDVDGTPWAQLYNKAMKLCDGFDTDEKGTLPCHPATVLYGHSASRGLDIARYSIGLDTGCVYKRRMTALVLGGKLSSDMLEDDYFDGEAVDIAGHVLSSKVKFGDNGYGKLYSVSCKRKNNS